MIKERMIASEGATRVPPRKSSEVARPYPQQKETRARNDRGTPKGMNASGSTSSSTDATDRDNAQGNDTSSGWSTVSHRRTHREAVGTTNSQRNDRRTFDKRSVDGGRGTRRGGFQGRGNQGRGDQSRGTGRLRGRGRGGRGSM